MRTLPRALAILAVLIPLSAAAEDFARTTAATQLVDLMNELNPFDAAMQEAAVLMLAPMVTNLPCPEKAAPHLQKTLTEGLKFSALRPHLITAYANNFSYTELNVIRSFYQTPTGARLLKMQPQVELTVQKETAKLMESSMAELTKTLAAVSKDTSCKAATPTAEKS